MARGKGKAIETIRQIGEETEQMQFAELLDKYSRTILGMMSKHGVVHLPAVLGALAANDPGTYAKCMISLLPKNVKVDMNIKKDFENMSVREVYEAYQVMQAENEQALALIEAGLQPGETCEFDQYEDDASRAKSANGRGNKGRRRRTLQ